MLSRTIVSITIVCSAWFLAQGVSQLVAGTFPVLHRTPPPAAVSGDPAKADRVAILRRNIFDPSTGPLPKPEFPVIQGPARTCEGPTRLVASIYSTHEPALSFASLSTGAGSPLLYRVGSLVDGKRIDAVYPEAVVLAQDGRQCLLSMFELRRQAELPNTYQLQRSELDELLKNPPLHAARVMPVSEAGRVVGIKLLGIRRDTLLEKLGLRNGDILRTINGLEIATPDAALQAYAQLRSATQLSIALLRRGVALTLEYRVQ